MKGMSGQLLPLFPLSLVLLPDAILPLHIFEERYKTMMAELIPQGGEFGVVLAKNQGIASIGCAAVVERILQKYEDGRLDLIARGRRRFLITGLDDARDYLRGEVEPFEDVDDTPAPPELRNQVLQASMRLLGTASDALDQSRLLSFQIAESLNDADKRQAVLSIRSEVDRLRFLLAILPRYAAEQERIELVKRIAPLNGHAKHVHSEE